MGDSVSVIQRNGQVNKSSVKELYLFEGLGKEKTKEPVNAGEIVAVMGLESFDIGDTIADSEAPEALKPISPQAAKEDTVRAQYAGGAVQGETVPGYLEELRPNSKTETFVAIKVDIDNWRWAGVPFYLRTGKRMKGRHSEIVVQFRETPHSMFGDTEAQSNRLVINVQPDEGVRLYLQIKEPGPGGLRIKSLPLNLSYADNFAIRYPDAYERLLMDVVRGNLSLFMRREEVEAAWKWVDGLLAAWDQADVPMETYQAGLEDGPVEARLMLRRDGRDWWEAS